MLDVEEKGYITFDDIYRLLTTSSNPSNGRNIALSSDAGSHDELRENKKSPSSNSLVQHAALSFKREMSFSMFQRGSSVNGIQTTQSRESGARGADHGKERINASGNIVLKQHDTEESREARMHRIHVKVATLLLLLAHFSQVKSIIEQADQDGDGKIRFPTLPLRLMTFPDSYPEFLLAMSCEEEDNSPRVVGGLRKTGSFVTNVRAGLSGLSRLGSAARITATNDDLVVQENV